jgi:hypothetical protein
MREEGAQNTRIWRLRTAALGGTGLRQATKKIFNGGGYKLC